MDDKITKAEFKEIMIAVLVLAVVIGIYSIIRFY